MTTAKDTEASFEMDLSLPAAEWLVEHIRATGLSTTRIINAAILCFAAQPADEQRSYLMLATKIDLDDVAFGDILTSAKIVGAVRSVTPPTEEA